MIDAFEKIGYTLSPVKKDGFIGPVELLVIHNPDGTARWIWPASVKKPILLKFYSANSLRSFIFSLVIQTLFLFRLQHLLFKSQKFFVCSNKLSNSFDIFEDWALFTGTTGPNNKSLVYHIKNGQGIFIKIAGTTNASSLIQKEAMTLNRLYSHNLQTIILPAITEQNADKIHQTDISEKTTRSSEFSKIHLHALIELNEISAFNIPLNELDVWHKTIQNLELLSASTDGRIPKGLVRKLKQISENINPGKIVEVCLSHGDFTAWNMYQSKSGLHVYDWELSNPMMPIGYDAFHFIIQQNILVKRSGWKSILEELTRRLDKQTFSSISKFNTTCMEDYLDLYLLFNITYYLTLYTEQKKWHPQIDWLLSTWNEALSSSLRRTMQERQLLIMDVFDYLSDKNYAAIKFPNMLPEKLSEYSDIDLCVEKKLNAGLSAFLKNHILVSGIKSLKLSFMASHQVICSDGSVLCLDLIWQLKRKHLQMMDIKEILNQSYKNPFGVKMPEIIDTSRYIGLFYILNNTAIPAKYRAYGQLLARSEKVTDQLLYNYFIDDTGNKNNVVNTIKSQNQNRGFQLFRNAFNYILDTLRTILFNKGMIITFSGVDGAGKSTVIENIKFKLEKQLRKRVVVIRHRPSVLPILSALTKGKEQAESDAASTLPRTGKNKSRLSSALRFGYYYTDYLFGQFVVYFKYVLRGYVVLYDRYYYDFINDSKRSNINLPEFLTRAGFRLLLKPKFNFFLYAKPEIILSRKKELDQPTILFLTQRYKALFTQLDKRYTSGTFQSIENIELKTTLDYIFKTIVKTAA